MTKRSLFLAVAECNDDVFFFASPFHARHLRELQFLVQTRKKGILRKTG